MEFIGNKKAVTFLQKSLERGVVGHAYLFSGPENVGKYTMACMLATSLIEGRKKMDKPNGSNPNVEADLLRIAPQIEEKKRNC